jgi:membrane-associated phospholipid phosphatase
MPTRTPLLAAIGIVLVTLLGVLVALDVPDPVDRAIMDAVRSGGSQGPLAFLDPITELGSTAAVTLVAIVCLGVGVAVGPWRHGAIGAATIGLASLGVEVLKSIVARDRPEILEPILVEHGFSFPSGHATLSMTAYGVLAVLVSRSRVPRVAKAAFAFVAALLVLAIGLSRVWFGVHYPSDVLAGWIAGAVIVVLYADLTRGVSREPAAAAVDAGREGPRSGPPAAA